MFLLCYFIWFSPPFFYLVISLSLLWSLIFHSILPPDYPPFGRHRCNEQMRRRSYLAPETNKQRKWIRERWWIKRIIISSVSQSTIFLSFFFSPQQLIRWVWEQCELSPIFWHEKMKMTQKLIHLIDSLSCSISFLWYHIFSSHLILHIFSINQSPPAIHNLLSPSEVGDGQGGRRIRWKILLRERGMKRDFLIFSTNQL